MSKKITKAYMAYSCKQRFPSNYEVARILGISEATVRALLEEYNNDLVKHAAASVEDLDEEYQEYLKSKATHNESVEQLSKMLMENLAKLKRE